MLKVLPILTDPSPETFFEQSNLWSEEIRNTCGQVIEYYKHSTLVDQGLVRPAAALSRSISEASFA